MHPSTDPLPSCTAHICITPFWAPTKVLVFHSSEAFTQANSTTHALSVLWHLNPILNVQWQLTWSFWVKSGLVSLGLVCKFLNFWKKITCPKTPKTSFWHTKTYLLHSTGLPHLSPFGNRCHDTCWAGFDQLWPRWPAHMLWRAKNSLGFCPFLCTSNKRHVAKTRPNQLIFEILLHRSILLVKSFDQIPKIAQIDPYSWYLCTLGGMDMNPWKATSGPPLWTTLNHKNSYLTGTGDQGGMSVHPLTIQDINPRQPELL